MQQHRRIHLMVVACIASLFLNGCTATTPSHKVSWTYSRAQIKAAVDKVNAPGASLTYPNLRVLFSAMQAICSIADECAYVSLEGTTVGPGSEFHEVVYHMVDSAGRQLTSSEHTLQTDRFSIRTIERLNREIGISP